ncbi:MAG: cobyrinate a,c-diamide synthase [Actinobacteria bacterium]|nr:cobyrinate a,c-diamide synthase [Actinomycetota bacterium]
MIAPSGFVLAGTRSGVGKTSLALGIMGALARRGHVVAPFKVGPDYIDPTYHASVCGRPSHNLDTWLMEPDEAVAVFERSVARVAREAAGAQTQANRAEIVQAPPLGGPSTTGRPGAVSSTHALGLVAVVEGVMGLFDGLAGGGERCSTGEMAKLLGLPVVLVIDCSHTARSAAAVVHGFRTFDPDLLIAGVILNKVAGPGHGRMVEEALAELASPPPVLGIVPRRSALHLESRHLGLIPTVEDRGVADVLERIIDHVEEHVDLDSLLTGAAPVDPGSGGMRDAPRSNRHSGAEPRSRVAIARDGAFSFYYQDNFDVLEEEGAELHFFSPVAGDRLPSGCDAVYLGGGYPEVYAAELAANSGLGRDLSAAIAAGVRVYAECGGYLYLGREIENGDGVHTMAGVLPTRASMSGARLRMGYVEATACERHPLSGAGFRGHLFHYSATTGSEHPAYEVSRKGETLADGYADDHLVASYVHLHFRGSRRMARWLALGVTSQEDHTHA